MTIESDDHTIILKADQLYAPAISGGPLSTYYRLHSLHFHWGAHNDLGSEHTINGKSYVMEMHVVHTKERLTFEEAKLYKDGIAVIGYFIELVPQDTFQNCKLKRDLQTFALLTKGIQLLDSVGLPMSLPKYFPLKNLVIPFETNYINYAGSLTTPSYAEAVTWIISPYTIKITQEELDVFRKLHERHLVSHEENFREIQSTNHRPVYFARPNRSYKETSFYFGESAPLYNDGYCMIKHTNVFKPLIEEGSAINEKDLDSEVNPINLSEDHAYYFNDNIKSSDDQNNTNTEYVKFKGKIYAVHAVDANVTVGMDNDALMDEEILAPIVEVVAV